MANDRLLATTGNGALETAVDPGQQSTQGFGESSMTRIAETASLALAEQAKAAVQARYIMAMQRPRDMEQVRKRLMADCTRPAFADSAIYRKPVGEGVEGPSIRMAEAAARAMGNILAEVAAIYDDRDKRIVRVSATDLEANVTYPKDVTVEKTIERSRPMPGRKIISQRKNSKGYDTFVIEATSDEILDKENALTSKALRTCLLRLIPGDILEEAMEACYRLREVEIKKDLPGARQRMLEAYDVLGVSAQQVGDYLGHAISDATTEELNAMRSLHAAIKAKETTWAEAFDKRRGPETEPAPTTTESLKDRLKARADQLPATAAKPATPPPAFTPEELARLDAEQAEREPRQ